jgi:hypothetical protein
MTDIEPHHFCGMLAAVATGHSHREEPAGSSFFFSPIQEKEGGRKKKRLMSVGTYFLPTPQDISRDLPYLCRQDFRDQKMQHRSCPRDQVNRSVSKQNYCSGLGMRIMHMFPGVLLRATHTPFPNSEVRPKIHLHSGLCTFFGQCILSCTVRMNIEASKLQVGWGMGGCNQYPCDTSRNPCRRHLYLICLFAPSIMAAGPLFQKTSLNLISDSHPLYSFVCNVLMVWL